MCHNCNTCAFVTPQKEIIYEIHITVNHRDTFVEDCYSIGVKPIIIDMGEGVPTHAMTSSTVKGSDESALSTAHNFASIFRSKGYEVERIKIETVPWHPKANAPDAGQYFETHFAVNNPTATELVLLTFAKHLHRSRNLLKKNDSLTQMYTYRSRDKEAHLTMVDLTKNRMTEWGISLGKVITEFALYDTNERMDDQWLRKNRNTSITPN